MKEIGSEFWTGCTPLDGQGVESLLPFGFNTQYTLCGRTGLEIIVSDILAVKNRQFKVYLPSYCCHTMIEPFITHGMKVVFYDVVKGENGIQRNFDSDNDCEIVFLMDYFGYVDTETVKLSKQQKDKGKILIYDATHSFFCSDIDYSHYDYVFGSFRKWIGVNAGFCCKKTAWIHRPELKQNANYISLRNKSFESKAQFMAGYEVDKQIFLSNFRKAEEYLESTYRNYAPDEASLRAIFTLNTDFLKTKRRENAEKLINAFSMNEGIVRSMPHRLSDQDCPLFVPLDVYPHKRTELRMYLVKNCCYLPVHWPVSGLHSIDEKTSYLYEHELSCICDQRYDKQDIDRLIYVINNFK